MAIIVRPTPFLRVCLASSRFIAVMFSAYQRQIFTGVLRAENRVAALQRGRVCS